MTGATHTLLLQQPYFDAVADGSKTFEIRRNEGRNFAVDDVLILQEFDADTDRRSGRELRARVSYVSEGHDPRIGYLLAWNVVVLALADVEVAS